MLNKADEIEYVSRYFAKDLLRDGMSFKPIEESVIKEQLLNGNQYIFDAISSSISLPIEEDELAVRFSKELEKCRELLWGDEDIPF